MQIQWQKDGDNLPTTSQYRVTVFDDDAMNNQVGNQIQVSNSAETIQRTISDLTPGAYYCIRVEWLNTVPQVVRNVCGRTCKLSF